MKSRIVIASLGLLLGVCCASAQQAARSTSNGVFTAEQAKNGERAYQARCASCHGADLRSTDPEAPDLTEGIFQPNWKIPWVRSATSGSGMRSTNRTHSTSERKSDIGTPVPVTPRSNKP